MNMKQFVPTGEIDLVVAPPSSGSIAISRNTTARQIRGWINAKCMIYVNFPDMDAVRCVFTGLPIGEEQPFSFVRCRRGDTRIVLCLASCKLDSRYEVVTTENAKAVTVFRTAIANMARMDRSIFSLEPPTDVRAARSKRKKHRREATNRRSSRQFALVQS